MSVMRFTALWGEQRMSAAPDGHWIQYPDLAASQSRVERLEAVIRNGLEVYTGNGHPLRADAELWNIEARRALTNDAGKAT